MNGATHIPKQSVSQRPVDRSNADSEQVTIELDDGFTTENEVTTPSDWEDDTESARAQSDIDLSGGEQPFWGLHRSVAEIERQLRSESGKPSKLNPFQLQQLNRDINVYKNRQQEDHLRNLARDQRGNEISRQCRAARELADTTNQLLFNGERDLHFISHDEFNVLDYNLHRDQYFITVDHQHSTLRYVDTNGSPRRIIIHDPQKQQLLADKINEKAHQALETEQPSGASHPANQFVTLKEDEFNNLITEGSIVNNDARTGHFSTSLAAQKMLSDRLQAAEHTAHRDAIENRFKQQRTQAEKTNWLIHQGSRKFHVYDDMLDLQGINLNRMEGDYILFRDVMAPPFPYRLFVIESGQMRPIPIPDEHQVSFIDVIFDKTNYANLVGGPKEFTLNQTDFETVIVAHTMRDNRPETAHFNSSRIAQQRRESLIRSQYFEQRWTAIEDTFETNFSAACKTNDLLFSGARNLQIITPDRWTAIVPDQHKDEYFIVQNGHGADRSFALHYVTPAGTTETISIQMGQQAVAFNNALKGRIDEQFPPAEITLSHDDFVHIVTNNTIVRDPGDSLTDRYVDDAHFSSSIEAQREKASRIRSVTEAIIARRDAENYGKLDATITGHWEKREYASAIFKRIDYTASKICTAVIDGTVDVLDELSRTVACAGEDICSAIACVARFVAPILANSVYKVGYGLERGANLAARGVYGPADYVGAQIARLVRWAAPYLSYAVDRTWYGLTRVGEGTEDIVCDTGAALCEQIARALRWAWPYFTEPAAWARFAVANTAEDVSRAIARGWYNNSLIHYVRRSRAEAALFRDAGQAA